MNRIDRCFRTLREQQQKALVTYIVSGDPSTEATLASMQELVKQGATIIELGVPFSDPMAEGPHIQRGHERALTNGTSLASTMDTVAEFRRQDQSTPVVLMGYANPIERMGYQTFAQRAAQCGVDGLITVDLPPEECEELNGQLKEVGIKNIFLLAPTTTVERAEKIISVASGFLYYVSLKGVTGAGHLDVNSVEEKLSVIRKMTKLPICVGFGIKDGPSAKAVAQYAEGVVIGSVLVNAMGEMAGDSAEKVAAGLGAMVAPIRKALNE